MEITSLMIYWITRLSYLKFGLGFLFLACAVILIFLFASDLEDIARQSYRTLLPEEAAKERKELRQKCERRAVGCIFFGFLAVCSMIFIPTSKEAAAMIIVPKIVNSQSVIEVGNGLVELAKDWILELTPKSQKSCE